MFDEALKVTRRCAVRAMCDWIRSGGDERRYAFVANWAKWWTLPGEAPRWRAAVLRELAAPEPKISGGSQLSAVSFQPKPL